MQTLDILSIIMEKTKYVATDTSLLLVAQVLLSSYMQVAFFYKTIKNSDFVQKVIACILPAALISTWCAIVSLTFGSFLLGGLSSEHMNRIVDLTLTERFIYELLTVAVVYVVVVILYLFATRPKWYQTLLTFGLETVGLVINLILFIGLHMKRFHMSDVKSSLFCAIVYGYFMVFYKTGLTTISLLAAAIFHEKDNHGLVGQREFLTDEHFEAYVIKFLNRRQKLTALSFATTIVFAESLPIYGLLWESRRPANLINIITVLNTVPGLILMFFINLGMACYLLIFAFFPRLSEGYRTLKKDSRLFERFYYEVVQNFSSLPTGKEISTDHFVVVKAAFAVKVTVKQKADLN